MTSAHVGLLRGTGPGLGARATAYPPEHRSLLRVLIDQARARPDADWLVFDGTERLTFGCARERVASVAAALGSGRDTTVALLMRNRVEFMPTLLGAQAAGARPVPLNPELRASMLQLLLARCEARTVVVEFDLLERLVDLDGLGDVEQVVCAGATDVSALPASVHGVPVVDYRSWTDTAPVDLDAIAVDTSDVAMLMFTSGTSGGSKAAVWTHHYMYLAAACVVDALEFDADEVLTTPLQMCHIAGLQVFAGASLVAGCTAHLKSRFSASGWWDEVARDGATFAMLMGPMTGAILRSVPAAPDHRLHTLYVLPQPPEREEFEKRYGTTIVWQGWGMTEIFPHLPRRSRIEDVPADTIGPPPSWVDFGVVDEHDQLLAAGVLGEMVYRPLIPDGMASGYHRDPEATARAFRNFMFHTGDLGYYDDEGRIHFVMRNQDSIRVRGENVSAVELEAVTLRHPHVLEAAAYAMADAGGQQEIKLDVVLADDSAIAGLPDWLQAELPRYMVPRWVERREALPRTPSQRVEKYRLAADGVDRDGVVEIARPRSRR